MGKADNLVTFFRFLAEDVREYLAEMGFRNLDEIIGRFDLLERNHEVDHWKTKNLDLSGMLRLPAEAARNEMHCIEKQENKIENILDLELICKCRKSILNKRACY